MKTQRVLDFCPPSPSVFGKKEHCECSSVSSNQIIFEVHSTKYVEIKAQIYDIIYDSQKAKQYIIT